VTLPKGIDGGYRLRVPRQGNAGVDGGTTGDLYVRLSVAPHPHFVRDEDDVRFLLRVGPAQATLGGRFEIPTFEGTESFDLPAGTQSGSEFRLRGKGMPRLRRSGSGDQVIVVQVVIPTDLSPTARDLLLAYAEEVGEAVHEEHGFFDRLKEVLGGRSRKGTRKN
jgi:molecular chaperone DnaJ